MAQPVWVLSVDLQTKTATFQSGMADAAKGARGAFSEIKSGASEMGGHVSTNMFASRHAIMAVSEAFGDTMPRAITALLVHIGPLGAALEAAFPFAAIALGAVLLVGHFQKIKQESQELAENQTRFGTAVNTSFGALDQKILQAELRADELRNNHLGALHKELELIDKQSMAELVHSLSEVAKSADVVFGGLKSHWYTVGIGADGAKHALEDFQTHYDSLLAQGKDKEASDLLRGTRESAEKILAMQNQAKGSLAAQSGKAGTDIEDQIKYAQATNTLKQAGVRWTDKEIEAQQTLVDALRAQVGIEDRVSQLKGLQGGNAKTTVSNEAAQKKADADRQAAEHAEKMGEAALAAEKEQAQAELAMRQASIAERLASDVNQSDAEFRLQIATNGRLQSALDKSGKDYQNQLKALQDKALELTAQHQTRMAQLQGGAAEAQYRKDLGDVEQGIRETIDATEKGSDARLAAIDKGIAQEQSRNLQNTSFYRELLTQRVEVVRQMAADEAKVKADIGKEQAENDEKIGQLALAREKEQTALRDSARRVTDQQRLTEAVQDANEEFGIKMRALSQQVAALDKGGREYELKLKQLQDKQKQLIQQHEDEITAIKDKAEIERNTRILSGERQFEDQLASGLAQTLMGHKSFGAMMVSIGDSVVSGMMENAIKSILANDMTKESDAAAAARKAYLAGMHFPFPTNIVMGPALGALAFASVMAFQSGTDMVPGQGRGDKVPAMLEPGEGVVPGGVMDGLRSMARSGKMGGGGDTHIHHSPTYHMQLIDGNGVQRMLKQHSREFTNHMHGELRKLNK